jgi:hypothetical protein
MREPYPDGRYDTDFDAWLEAQVHALATGAWAALDIPHLCEELDGVRRHYLREPEWSLTQLIEARLVWDYAPEQRAEALGPVDRLRAPSHEGGAAAPRSGPRAESEPVGAKSPSAVASGGGVSHDSAAPWAAYSSYRFAFSPL